MAVRFRRFSQKIAQWPSFASGVVTAALVLVLAISEALWAWYFVVAAWLVAVMTVIAPERRRYRAMSMLTAAAAVFFLPAVREAGMIGVLLWAVVAGVAVGVMVGLTRMRTVHEREMAEAMTTALVIAVSVGAGMLLGMAGPALLPFTTFAALAAFAIATTLLCHEEFKRNSSIRSPVARAAAWVGGLLFLQALFASRILPFSPIEGGILIGLLLVLYREAVALAAEGLLSRRRFFIGAFTGIAGFLVIFAAVGWSV
jgi:hypothetical protein